MTTESASPQPSSNWRRKLLFSLIALLIFLLPLALFEVVLVCRGWTEAEGLASETRDPFIGFSGDQRLFALDDSGDYYSIRESRLGYFRPARFLAEKPSHGFRVFVVGGSTVQGRPWETETAFAKWLELALQTCEPNSNIEVVNCGGVSYASYRLSLIVDEIVDYSPDLIILCTGHNEYLEKRTYQSEVKVPAVARAIHRFLSYSRTYRWIRSKVIQLRKPADRPTVLDEKVITRLDFENGLNLFDEQSLQRDAVQAHFRFNLERMIDTCQQNQIRTIVVAPPSNQKDCFPFKPRADWSPGDISEFATLSLTELESVPDEKRTADYFFFRATRKLEAAQRSAAEEDFNEAIDRDICPIRMTTALRQQMLETVRQAQRKFGSDQVMYLDMMQRCQAETDDGIVGERLLVDHVHPSIQTHRKWASWIMKQLQRHQLVVVREDWEEDFEQSAAAHLKSLGFGYFQRGSERLESVKKWARGQAVNPLTPTN